ncbi:MAG: pantoate--beta-alanine ligase [Armatimonadota bacterium]
MTIVRTVAEYCALSLTDVGFVPTMGALHAGHCELIKATSSHQNRVVSIFVNPTQFGPNEDLTRYPRPFERDVELASEAGANVIFAPTVEEMYPSHPTMIHVPIVTEHFEGSSRPGHFHGVATIVAKLFGIVQPTTAYFGQKDLQQCAVITKMVKDLNLPVQIQIEPTIREADGLAMSSRNVYLTPEQRSKAPQIYRQLCVASDAIWLGANIHQVLEDSIQALNAGGFEVDYFALIERNGFAPTHSLNSNLALITAAKLGTTRLIDNVLLD